MRDPGVTGAALVAHLSSIGPWSLFSVSTMRTTMRLQEVHRAAGNGPMVGLLGKVQEEIGKKPRLVGMVGEMHMDVNGSSKGGV